MHNLIKTRRVEFTAYATVFIFAYYADIASCINKIYYEILQNHN